MYWVRSERWRSARLAESGGSGSRSHAMPARAVVGRGCALTSFCTCALLPAPQQEAERTSRRVWLKRQQAPRDAGAGGDGLWVRPVGIVDAVSVFIKL